ncbi:MAG TPA: histidine phosphatase family protein [Myxococcota bacterium]|jgi:broad specificity phosphatase PhoE
MRVYWVRHAAAVRRSDWRRPEKLRPLTGGGHRQAHRLLELFDGAPISHLLTSPDLRCRQTLEPLAAQRGLPIQLDGRLSAGRSVGGALELLGELGDGAAVLCSHGDVIPRVIERLCDEGLRLDRELVCEKGSVWIVDAEPGRRARARYVPPPAKAREPGVGELEDAEPQARGKLRVGVLDLGSTSFHLLVADATPTGEIRRVAREREMLRLGALVARGGNIPEAVCVRAIEVARQLRRRATASRVEQLYPVATSALRDARNGRQLARRIGAALGTPVRVLSGEEEAHLMFAAFRQRLAVRDGPALGIDLGGGSLELALGDDSEVHWEATLPLGVARLHGEFVNRDPMTREARDAIRARVRGSLAAVARRLARRRRVECVGAGGTLSALARRIVTRRTSWPARAVNQLFLPISELREVAAELVESTHEERLRMPGLQKPRADLLPTGAVVLETLASELSLPGITVSDWGLREGVILEALGLESVRLAGAR